MSVKLSKSCYILGSTSTGSSPLIQRFVSVKITAMFGGYTWESENFLKVTVSEEKK